MSLDHPFEEPTTTLGLVHQFHVRLDPALVHQPPDHLGRAIAPIGDQARRGDVELFSVRSSIALAAPSSAWRMAVVARLKARPPLPINLPSYATSRDPAAKTLCS